MDKQPRAGIIGIEIYWPSRFVKQTELGLIVLRDRYSTLLILIRKFVFPMKK